MKQILTTMLICAVCFGARAQQTISDSATLSSTQMTEEHEEVSTVKNGVWSDKSIWSNGKLPDKNTCITITKNVVLDMDANVCCITIAKKAKLTFDDKNIRLSERNSMKVLGTLVMKPVNGKNILRFTNIDESKIQGATDAMSMPDEDAEPEMLDCGLWVLGAGKLDLKGSEKTSWTYANGSVNKGATSVTVEDASGWKINDQIVVIPTDMPPEYPNNWDDKTGTMTDVFFVKFEVRTITAISGNKISFAQPLIYDHLVVSSAINSPLGNQSRKWKPEVINLTRNVVICGTKSKYNGQGYEWQTNHRAHIFISSTSPQSVRYVEGRYLGPEKLQNGENRPSIITGRYGLHFHHCADGSVGSIVEGCSFWRLGNRGFVPHESNGIAYNNNTLFDILGEGFFWDFQELSHQITYTHNLIASVREPQGGGGLAMLLGEGDFNVAKNNTVVYAGSCYQWEADNESVWTFDSNIAHSSKVGIDVWQNTGNIHTITAFDAYNCLKGISHGAYGNGYVYRGGYLYNAPIFVIASSVVFSNYYVDGAGLPYCSMIQDSPSTGSDTNTNPYIECAFRNYTIAPIELRSQQPMNNPEKNVKDVDLISCDFPTTKGYQLNDYDQYALKDGNRIRVQPISGQPYQVTRQNGVDVSSNTGMFAPKIWGNGTGLQGKYYNGSNFKSYAFTRTDAMIRFDQFSYDIKKNPTGVNYLITDNTNFSIEWTGQIEAQYSELYTFFIVGAGADKLWVNGQLIIDAWTIKEANSVTKSKKIQLEAGKKYNIKIEHSAKNKVATIILQWQSPTMKYIVQVPGSQLYPTATTSKISNTMQPMVAADNSTASTGLQQNTPNPANSTTTISYTLPKNVTTAKMVITSVNGSVVQERNIISKGDGSISIDVSKFAAGTYTYTLYADGKQIDSKHMVVLK